MADANDTALTVPNFFILGAAKSGTTSLHYYLDQHPGFFMSEDKEPGFWLDQGQLVKSPAVYFGLFDSVDDERIIGESSHAYLTSPETPRLLAQFFPDAKFVVILRHPADRAYSHYNHMRRHGFERLSTFEEGLEAEDGRYSSEQFRASCTDYLYNYLYFRTGLYGEQINRYLRWFEPEQFHFTTLHALKTEPLAVVNDIASFVGEDPMAVPLDTEVQNSGHKTARFPWLGPMGRRVVGDNKRLLEVGWKLSSLVNFKEVPPLADETRTRLSERYEEDLQLVHELTGLQLS